MLILLADDATGTFRYRIKRVVKTRWGAWSGWLPYTGTVQLPDGVALNVGDMVQVELGSV